MAPAVVHGELFARRDRAAGVELGTRGGAAHEGIGIARVVDEAEAASRARGVDRVALELDDGDDAPPLRAPPRLAQPDDLALELADLLARADARSREESPSNQPALSDRELV